MSALKFVPRGSLVAYGAKIAPIRSACVVSRFFSVAVSHSEVTVEALKGEHDGIRVISLNRPSVRNAFSRKLLGEFSNAIDDVRADSDARVVILRSLVPGVFSAGADLKERLTMSQSDVGAFVNKLRETFSKFEALPQPTVAAIDGAALGGGLELALCADIRTVGKGARVGLPETKLAIIPGAGGTQRLSRLIGISRAKELIFTGRSLDANEAFRWGIANHAVEDGFLKSLELASEMLRSGPIALRAAKAAITTGTPLDLATGLKVEQLCYNEVIPTDDRMEALKAMSEKRPPLFKGR
ncbi:ClpP/crotonase [Gonapodya prolifera JEL478]|uniref:ClpP/crotonase n=1 Tax=Gonapodya prolifera (strain JEL478) TaxID=1344416 RepID=A0A139AXN8_GONPJ|nr:ClpP/crotonase [Gonapodya prolifera JEL478]|eukprot:KXS21511.1 ClpP/crotonase [Gonapodya prolifera JEL478]